MEYNKIAWLGTQTQDKYIYRRCSKLGKSHIQLALDRDL